MGNAESSITCPSGLSATVSYLESGKFDYQSITVLHFEKKDGVAVGCGGNVIFKKNVISSSYTYKVTKTNSQNLQIGYTDTVEASGGKEEAESKLAVQLGMSSSEVREVAVMIKTKVDDDPSYSELYVYVDYNGKRNRTVK